MDPITIASMAIMGLGSLTQGITGAVGNQQNVAATAQQQAEAREMANRQFDWGQTMDRAAMAQQEKQGKQEELNNRMVQLKDLLQTHTGLQDRLRNLYSKKAA